MIVAVVIVIVVVKNNSIKKVWINLQKQQNATKNNVLQ